MAKQVQLPDGRIGEFPDNMDNAAIEAVLRRQFAEPTWSDRGQELLQGAKARFDDAALGIKGLMPQSFQDAGDWVDKKLGGSGLTKETAVQAPDTWAGTLGGIGADVLMTAVPAANIARAATVLPKAMQLGRGASAFTNAATQVGGNAAMSAAMSPEDRGIAAALGGVGTAAGMGLQRALGGLVKPLMSDNARAMVKEGVRLTPGQAAGGAFNDIEKKLTSLPFAGHGIAKGRQQAFDDAFMQNADMVMRDLPGPLRTLEPQQSASTAVALRPDAVTLRDNAALARTGKLRQPGSALPQAMGQYGPKSAQVGRNTVAGTTPGNETMVRMRDAIGDVFDNALSVAPDVPIDITRTLQSAVKAVHSRAMNEADKEQVLRYVSNNLLNRVPGASPGALQNLSATEIKAMESGLRKEAMDYIYSPDPDKKKIGQALMDVHATLRDMLGDALQGAHPDAAAALREGERAWRAFLPLDAASNMMGAQSAGGVAQPKQLLSALRKFDKSQNDNALRKKMVDGGGDAAYDRLVANMVRQSDVFGDAVADSGTAGRNSAVVGSVMALSNPASLLGAGLAWAGAHAAYRPAGKRLLTMGVAPETTERFLAWAAQKGLPPDMVEAQLPNLLAAFGRESQ